MKVPTEGMKIGTSRRDFLRGLAGASVFAIGGACPIGGQKIKLAAVGIMGKGFDDWTSMLKTGLVEMVAFCDCDATMRGRAQTRLAAEGIAFDMCSVPFYTDYRRLLDDAGALGIEAMTISTPDHVHAPVAIRAMKQGIHVYVQTPLVRTLWELDYFNRTARERGAVVQMGNQGSSLDSLRRSTEVIQSGILGDVKEVHVWTNRVSWAQGQAVAVWVRRHPNGNKVRSGLNWDAWLATARARPFLDRYPKEASVCGPLTRGTDVYHAFAWRGFSDFGCGALGDRACHMMNLPFRGLELAGVSDAECLWCEESNDVSYPAKSVVRMTFKARDSKARPGVRLPEVTLFWHEGVGPTDPCTSGNRPTANLMAKVTKTFGSVPDTGCCIIGSKGSVFVRDDYGENCMLALNDDGNFVDVLEHEAAKGVARTIPFCNEGHSSEFLRAIRGEGGSYEQTHSRCFSDVEHCIPQMEGILIGCIAQQVPGRLLWDAARQAFAGNAAANALVRPYVREGWEF